jgi:hypothetical protein
VSDLKKLIDDLKKSIKGKKLSRTDRLLLDILSEMTDILTSGLEEKLSQNIKRRTSNPLNEKEIRNEKVLSLRDFLRARGRSYRRK